MSSFDDLTLCDITQNFTCTRGDAKNRTISAIVPYMSEKYGYTTTWTGDYTATVSGKGVYSESKITIGTSTVEVYIRLTIPFNQVSNTTLKSELSSSLTAWFAV